MLDIVTAALKEIGVLASGETPTSGDASDAMDALNRLIDQWQAERLSIYTITRTPWTIVSGTQDYAVGTGVTVNTPRPVFPLSVGYVDTAISPTLEIPLSPLTDQEYAGVAVKGLTGTQPVSWFYNPTYPTGTISLFPIPTSTTLQGLLYSPTAVQEFAALTTTVALPPGYRRMLVTNLAAELMPSYEKQPDAVLLAHASDSKAAVKRANFRIADLQFPSDALINGGGSWDIHSGP